MDAGWEEPMSAEQMNLACFHMARRVDAVAWARPEAPALVRRLLRVAGRVIIDMGGQGAGAEAWDNTETTVLQWLREALTPLGYDVTPLPASGRPPLADPQEHS